MAGELQTTITFADGDQVTSAKLNQIISGATFGEGAVTGTTLSVVGGKLKVGTITDSEVGSGAVTTTGLAAGAVTTAKIADGAITAAKMGTSSVGSSALAAGAVTFDRLNSAAVATTTQMAGENSTTVVTPNRMAYSPVCAKAYGSVSISGSSRPLSGSYNIGSVSKVSTTQTRVFLATDMASGNYTVVAVLESDGSYVGSVSVYGKSTGNFNIRHPAEGAADQRINFIVFGDY